MSLGNVYLMGYYIEIEQAIKYIDLTELARQNRKRLVYSILCVMINYQPKCHCRFETTIETSLWPCLLLISRNMNSFILHFFSIALCAVIVILLHCHNMAFNAHGQVISIKLFPLSYFCYQALTSLLSGFFDLLKFYFPC